MRSRITSRLAPWRHLAPWQCQKTTSAQYPAPAANGLSEAISSCVQAAARRRWRTCWLTASRCHAQPPQSAATPSSRCCQHTAHNQLQISSASNLRAVLAIAAVLNSAAVWQAPVNIQLAQNFPARFGLMIPSTKFGCTQLVEYQEGGDEAGSRKQSYFVELWDVGASLPSFFFKRHI